MQRSGFLGAMCSTPNPRQLAEVYTHAGLTVPAALDSWNDRVAGWCGEYDRMWGGAEIVAINLEIAVFVFDLTLERVLLAYGISSAALHDRDRSRMRGFPDVNIGVRAGMGDDAFEADRGHFLGHAAGGELDINLFPQRRELNQGWSAEGKVFRQMERYAAEHPGTFMYHRAVYDDDSWIPARLHYGLLKDGREWWEEEFRNK